MFGNDFYPTPAPLIKKLLEGIEFGRDLSILEPSAGKGDICDFIQAKVGKYNEYSSREARADIDCCEIDENLQHILKGKEYHVVCDDFLTYNRTVKPYDLIVANFPFSAGDRHLSHALRLLEKSGGELRAIINAETLRNPYTIVRQTLVADLQRLGADIEYLTGEFESAERKTSVEIAIVKLVVEHTGKTSVVLEGLRKAIEEEREATQAAALVTATDYKSAMIQRFELECRVGSDLIDEWQSLRPYILDSIDGEYQKPLIRLKVNDKDHHGDERVELVTSYLRGVRFKYWKALLRDSRFRSNYTSNITEELERRLTELKAFDFNRYNIDELEKELQGRIAQGIEDSILKLFEKFSYKYAFDESIHSGNVHYYNGWKSNKAWKVNNKIVLPLYLLESGWNGKMSFYWGRVDEITDMLKVFNYLSNDIRLNAGNWSHYVKEKAVNEQNFRNMDFRFFELTAYKKGTVHIKFKDKEALDKLNIFGSQRKGWLPPSYGKHSYDDLSPEEQAVIEEFQGREAYERVCSEPQKWIVEPKNLLLTNGEG